MDLPGPAGPPQDVAGLLSIRAADAAAADDLEGSWVPQLDAAQVADDAAASGYSARHRDRAALLPVLLLRGDDVTADDLDDGWWLTVAAQGFPDEGLDTAIIQVTPESAPDSVETKELVENIRAMAGDIENEFDTTRVPGLRPRSFGRSFMLISGSRNIVMTVALLRSKV